MSRVRRRRGGERGVTVLEAAFAVPLLLFLFSGLVDLGFAAFQTSQASAAARDGARAGILDQTDVAQIESEVEARLTGREPDSITITCLAGLSGSTPVACASAVPHQDRIRVSVEWSYSSISFFGGTFGVEDIRATSTMVITGRPIDVTPPSTTTTTTTTTPGPTSSTTSTTSSTTTTSIPGACVVTNLSFEPAPLELANNGKHLRSDTVFTVTTNGAPTCSDLAIRYPTKGGPATSDLTSAGPGTWTSSVKRNKYDWEAGDDLPFDVLSSGGTLLRSFAVDVG